MTNQKPTVGKKQIDAAKLVAISNTTEEKLISDSIEPHIVRTTEIGTKTLNRVSKLAEGIRETARTTDQSSHKPMKDVIWTGSLREDKTASNTP